MLKVKHERTADCVVAGFRWHKDGEGVGSLLLGLFDDDGVLHHVGVASSFTAARRARAGRGAGAAARERAREPPVAGVGRVAQARTDGPHAGREQPVDAAARTCRGSRCGPELVAEVRYEHLQSGRFRHGGRLVRFRPDRTPESCTYAQLEEVAARRAARSCSGRPGDERARSMPGRRRHRGHGQQPGQGVLHASAARRSWTSSQYYLAVSGPILDTLGGPPAAAGALSGRRRRQVVVPEARPEERAAVAAPPWRCPRRTARPATRWSPRTWPTSSGA